MTDALPQRRSLDIDLCLPLHSLSLSISCSIYLSTDLGEGTPASDRRIGASADNSPPHTSTYTAGAHTDTHIYVHVRAKIDARLFRHRRVHALIPRRLNLPLMPPVIETLAKTPFLPPKPTTTRISKFPYISFFSSAALTRVSCYNVFSCAILLHKFALLIPAKREHKS